jgi:hypothetical protein
MALGAARFHILRIILREGFSIGGCRRRIGIAGALMETRLLRNLLFGIEPSDPFAFGAAAAGLLLVILLAIYLPRRAMSVDPIIAIRCE